ncbi:Nucleosome assembly protein (NAP) [Popillia japonica]|uniref:Nucleosome assembly protein (NAP) n=1 Tax=Popillia japonica TaxID=7064 RepID=A0AAW1MTI0_POPJA
MRKVGDTSNSEDGNERNHNDEEIQKALEEVDSCQNEIDALNEQASDEIIKVEQKYNLLRNPLYHKRDEGLNKIPHFWVTAFVNHPDLSTILSDSEEDCLHHLSKVEVQEYEDIKSGYKLSFFFDENPYFENRVLTKEYHLESLEEPTCKSTAIKWKEGFDLTTPKHIASKPGQKRGREHKSFFSWFNDHSDPLSDDIAEIIKDDIYINPLQYFLVPDVGVDNGVDDEEGSDQEDENEEQSGGIIGDTDEDTHDIQNTVSEEPANA